MEEGASYLRYGRGSEPVKLGDKVEYSSLLTLFRRRTARVCYVPGQNPPHPEMEFADGQKHWGILFDDGRVLTWLFAPKEFPAPKSIRFRERGDPDSSFLESPFSSPENVINEEDRREELGIDD